MYVRVIEHTETQMYIKYVDISYVFVNKILSTKDTSTFFYF